MQRKPMGKLAVSSQPNKKSDHVLWTLLCVVALFASGFGHADVAAEKLQEIYGATAAGGLCFGIGTPVIADVHPSAGDEIIYMRKKVTLKSDTDGDGSRVLNHVVSVVVKSSSTKQTLYESAPLAVNSQDIVLPIGNSGYQVVSTFNPGNYSRFINFLVFPLAIECTSMTVAVHGGKAYIVVGAGTSAADGDPNSGTDRTRIRMRVIDGANGSTANTFSIYAKANSFIAPFFPPLVDIDDDGNIELLIWRANAQSATQIRLVLRTYDLLTGAAELVMAIPLNDSFTLEP